MVKILCEKCGREISKSSYSKHLRGHENHPEYYDNSKYHLDHDDLFCKFCNKECKNKNSLAQHEIRCKNNPDRISYDLSKFNTKGRPAWNKGLTKHTSDSLRRSSETFKRNYRSGKFTLINPMSNPETRKKLSESMRKAYSVDYPRVHGRSKHGWYKGIWCDSSWELAYVVYNIDHGVNFIRNNKGFKYSLDDGIHTYFPDFYLPDIDTYVEIKGYEDKKADAKHSQFEHNLTILREDDLVKYINYAKDTYGDNFINLYDKICCSSSTAE